MEERRLQAMRSSSTKGGEEMSQSAGPRLVSKYVEGVIVNSDVDASTIYSFSNSTNHTGWTLDGGQGILKWQGYIDLSGYRPDDMVLQPAQVVCQYGGAFISAAGAASPGGNIYMQYAMTTDKIDDLDYGAAGVAEPLAGFIGDNSEMEQVIYAGTEAWGPASAGLAMINQQKMIYGDAPPIVGPRIYVAVRAVLQPAVQSGAYVDTTFSIPPMRFLILGNATEVPEFQLLHLMKRQVDLQQTPDVDA